MRPLTSYSAVPALTEISDVVRGPFDSLREILAKNDAAVDRMAASIREFGFKIPMLVRSSGEIVDGTSVLKPRRSLESARCR
jgi:hypothetical protein